MFTQVSHSYLLEVAALYCSFIPALAVLGIIAGAWCERTHRRIHARALVYVRTTKPRKFR